MAKKLSDLIGQFATIPNSFILATVELSTEAKWLFVILRYHTNSKTGNAFPSYNTIHEITGFHRNTIAKSLKELEAAGWITKQRRYGATTVYALQIPSSHISETTDMSSSSPDSTISSPTSETISSSDGVYANQTEEGTRQKEPDRGLSAHAGLMNFLSLKVGHIGNGAKEGKAAKWLLENGYDPVECINCFEYLAAQEWRTSAVTWVTVQSQIGAWLNRSNGNGNGHHPPQSKNSANIQASLNYLSDLSKTS